MKTETQQIHDTLQSQFCSDTIRHAAFLAISRAATERAIKGHNLSEYLAMQDHGTVLMAEDLGLDLSAIRRAGVALQRAGVVISHMGTHDAPIPEGLPIW